MAHGRGVDDGRRAAAAEGLLDAVGASSRTSTTRPTPARLEELLLHLASRTRTRGAPLRELVDDTPLPPPRRDGAIAALAAY